MIGWIAFVLLLLAVSGLWAADRAGKRIMAEREAEASEPAPAVPPHPAGRRQLKVGGTDEMVDLL